MLFCSLSTTQQTCTRHNMHAYVCMPFTKYVHDSGFFKAEIRYFPQKTISSALVYYLLYYQELLLVLSKVNSLYYYILYYYLCTYVHLLNKYFIMYISCMFKMHAYHTHACVHKCSNVCACTHINFIHLCRCTYEYCICISCKLMLVRMYVCMHVLYACMHVYLRM